MIFVDYGMEPRWEPPVEDDRTPRRGERVSVRSWLRHWVAIVGLGATVAGGGWLAERHYETHLAGAAALDAAKAYMLRLTNIDADNVDQNFADIADGSTGEFLIQHSRSGPRLRQLLVDGKAKSRGHITEAVVKSASRDEAVVVLLVNQSIRNADHAEPVLDRSRVRLTMDRVDGRWLANRVELI